MKYIFIRGEDGLEFPVFCVAPKTHADMAAAWRRNDRSVVLSAGFVDFGPFAATGTVVTFGMSTSLGLHPREHDAKLIAGFYKQTLVQTAARPA